MRFLVNVSAAALLLFSTQARATESPAAPAAPAAKSPVPSPAEVKSTGKAGQASATRIEKVRAKVKAVDAAARTVTLVGEDGVAETIKLGPEVKRFAEIAPGDTVVVELEKGLLLEYQAAGSETVPPQEIEGGGRASADRPPAGAAIAGVHGTVVVTAIDSKSRVVAFQGPHGTVHQVKAGPDIKLEKLKVGDRLLATYVESVAIKLEKAKPAAADASKKTKK